MTERRGNIVGLLAAAVAGAVVAGVGVFFVITGVKDANQWAGVFGFFIGVLGLVVSGYSAVLTRRSLAQTATPPAGPRRVANTNTGSTFHAPVFMAGGDVTGVPGGSPPGAAPPAASPAGGDAGGSVSSTISGGTFHGPVQQGRDFTYQPPGSRRGTGPQAGGSPAGEPERA